MNKVISNKINAIKKELLANGTVISTTRVIKMLDELSRVIDRVDIQEAGGKYELDEEARAWLEDIEEKGLQIEILKHDDSDASLTYEVSYLGSPVGRGMISNEGLSEDETRYKIAKMADAEKILEALELPIF